MQAQDELFELHLNVLEANDVAFFIGRDFLHLQPS